MIGVVDRARIQRAFRYLSQNSSEQSVSLNSFISLYATRYATRARREEFIVMVKRKTDNCVLCRFSMTEEEELVRQLESELKENGSKPKCLICCDVSITNGYCHMCSVMMTTLDETCPVCLDDARKEAVWVRTECGHSYHHECLARVKDKKCPMCRKVLEEEVKII